ncbi:hypothetical protein BT63DRAFT_449080 [Microthyrium microscopicum]|uniref:Uncharacterized protein n=1 Tax=Microthyrium microscopicum TaxID=703497 RepID=A0A6A6URJ9_9PEZI|nr:hypothetical protein BT63DRAFT_449080 [Microthyrium microscopicum]
MHRLTGLVRRWTCLQREHVLSSEQDSPEEDSSEDESPGSPMDTSSPPPEESRVYPGHPYFALEEIFGSSIDMNDTGITRPLIGRLHSLNDIKLPPVDHPLLLFGDENGKGPFWQMDNPKQFRSAFDLGFRLCNYLLNTPSVLGGVEKWYLEDIPITPNLLERTNKFLRSRACTERLTYIVCTREKSSPQRTRATIKRAGKKTDEQKECKGCMYIKQDKCTFGCTGPKVAPSVDPYCQDMYTEFNSEFGEYARDFKRSKEDSSLDMRCGHLRINFVFAITLLHELIHLLEYIAAPAHVPAKDLQPHPNDYEIHFHQHDDSEEWGCAWENDFMGGFLSADDEGELLPVYGLCLLKPFDDPNTGMSITELVPMDRVLNWFSKSLLDEVFYHGGDWPVETDVMTMTIDPNTNKWQLLRQ